jgi:hypothetical protein
MALAKEIEVRECAFRERNSDITESLMEKVFVFEAQLFGLHAGTIMDENVLSRPNTPRAVNDSGWSSNRQAFRFLVVLPLFQVTPLSALRSLC